MFGENDLSFCSSKLTQPVFLRKPYSADKLSPTIRIRVVAVVCSCAYVLYATQDKVNALSPAINCRRSGENLYMLGINAIEVKGLCQRVADATGALTILNNINFTIPSGQSVSITGPSGSGKSTLLGLMAGLDIPSEGTVILLEQDLFAMNEDGRAALRAKNVGFVFQSFHLLPNLTALENVMLPLELSGQEARGPAQHMLEQVGLSHRLDHFPATLSGGEQQRVSLARAFVQRPAILFADEPTGSLDEATGTRIIDLMFKLHEQFSTTLILVTHDLNLAARCERQLVLHAGELAQSK